MLVTRGAAFRDLAQLEEAESCAMQAMESQPDNHQPYTLMGAICYDQGRILKAINGLIWLQSGVLTIQTMKLKELSE